MTIKQHTMNYTAFHKSGLCLLAAITIVASATGPANANPIPAVYPVLADGFSQSLNGEWSFRYKAGEDAGEDAGFIRPDFDASAWKTFPVPANWETKGIVDHGYDVKGIKDGIGFYRRNFRIAPEWRADRRVFLRFEGVAYGFEAWVNGRKVGESSASAYNPHTFDITDAVMERSDGESLLAVKVLTRPFGYEFDANDDWSFSGIFRDVTLFSVPAVHARDLTTSTTLATDGAAELSVSVLMNRPGSSLRGRLIAPDGETAGEFALEDQGSDRHHGTLRVTEPQLWTAESPLLYRLQVTVSADGAPIQTIDERIGLREITIIDGVLLLNGRSIKLRGVNLHELDPVDGRAVSVKRMRSDLEMIRKGNMNHVRTSHYPPSRELLELCDEMGIYVMDEVPVGRGDEHLQDPAYQENLLARTDATVTRDKNHASVIVWSIGNEDPWSELLVTAAKRATELDPTRPVCFPQTPSWFEKTRETQPEFLKAFSPHYPTNEELREQAKTLKRPTIYSEYVHAWGLGLDRLETQWEIIQSSPLLAGAAIWHFHDQGVLRTVKRPLPDDKKPRGSAWLDDLRYYDSHNADGCDGIVYADRTPQTDFWETRKVYAPVRIEAASSTALKPGHRDIELTIANRHDFRSLGGMRLAWSLLRNGKGIQDGEIPLAAAAHGLETVRIPVEIPADTRGDVLALDVRCLDEDSNQITERGIRLDPATTPLATLDEELKAKGEPKMTESEHEVTVTMPEWILTLSRPSGELTIRDLDGKLLVAGVHPHTARHFSLIDNLNASGSRRARPVDIWQQPMLTRLESPVIKVAKNESSVSLSVSGTYPRSDKPGQALVGGYQVGIAPNGTMRVDYEFAPNEPSGILLEAGLSVVLPAPFTEFRWIGQGPYPAYPGKELLSEFGIFHLNRGDLNFQGNRRGTEIACLTSPGGTGMALACSVSDVAIQREGDHTLLSHNAVVSGLGNKGWMPESTVNLKDNQRIAGSFTLVPLGNDWPRPLIQWFGKPTAATNVFRPFSHSYDQ